GRDIRLADRSIEDVHVAQALFEELHERALSQPAETAIALGSIVESIRRLAEYSGDIAEGVINHVVDREA
ncbi:MAG: phosphate uptake regulator PhoU, partial [Methanoregulaceae archaeon]